MTGRNCAAFVERSIHSVADQRDIDLHVLFIDDASTDGTGEVAQAVLRERLPDRHTYVRNAERKGKARNAHENLTLVPDATFVVIVDADDFLVGDEGLCTLAAEYGAGWDVVWTQFRMDRGVAAINVALDPFVSPRAQPWRSSHLFSFRRMLWDSVPASHLQDASGAWYASGCDLAIAYPVLDQTRRYRFLPLVMYHYNTNNPLSHHNAGAEGLVWLESPQQRANGKEIIAKPSLPCTRWLNDRPSLLESETGRLMGELRSTIAVQERKVQALEQQLVRAPLDAWYVHVLVEHGGVPVEWLGQLGGWSLEPAFLVYLAHVLGRFPRPRVLEFGSGGASTVIAKLCETMGATLVSVEHDPTWYQRTAADLEARGLAHMARVQLAPLVEGVTLGVATRFYDLSWMKEHDRFDVVIVDGPPTSSGPLARLQGLPAIRRHLAPGFRLYLDDYEREHEQKIVAAWRAMFPDLQFRALRFSKSVCEVEQANGALSA